MLKKIKTKGENNVMLKKIKCNVQLIVKRWNKIDKISRFISTMTIIAVILTFAITPDREAFIKEENYVAMEQLVYSIIEENNTDIDFDTSKINIYNVTYKKDGSKKIYIQGKTLEEMSVILDENYQIKQLIMNKRSAVISLYIMYIILVEGLAFIITYGIFFINRTIRKIFFNKK